MNCYKLNINKKGLITCYTIERNLLQSMTVLYQYESTEIEGILPNQ